MHLTCCQRQWLSIQVGAVRLHFLLCRLLSLSELFGGNISGGIGIDMVERLGGAVMISIWVVGSAVGGGCVGFGGGGFLGGGFLGGGFLLGGGGGLCFSLLLYCCSKDCSGLRD